MSYGKRTIAVFDFDGTLTQCDTLVLFIRHTHGWLRMLCGLLCCAPFLIRFKLGYYSNDKAKERLFSYFYKGMDYAEFKRYGEVFAEKVEKVKNGEMVKKAEQHNRDGHMVYVVSASIVEWVSPWCKNHGMEDVLCTEAEVGKDGRLTGRFKTPNCYGQEKVRRLLAVEPNRDTYELYAYGDSRGDKDMIDFADHGVWVCK